MVGRGILDREMLNSAKLVEKKKIGKFLSWTLQTGQKTVTRVRAKPLGVAVTRFFYRFEVWVIPL
jgi:hypothetical protein